MEKKATRTRTAIAASLFIVFNWAGQLIGWVSGLLGIVVDTPVAMEGLAKWHTLIPDPKWFLFVLLAAALWKLPPLVECDAWVTTRTKSWLGMPSDNRWRYILAAFIGGLVMAISSVSAAKSDNTVTLGWAIVAGVAAFLTTYMIALAARSDTTALEVSLDTAIKSRDDYKSQAESQYQLVLLQRRKLRDAFEEYMKEGEKKLRERREDLISLENAAEWYRVWKIKWYALEKGSPFTSGLRGAVFNPHNELPRYIDKGSPDANFYLPFKKDLLFIEERILPRLNE